jgi:hypothetical protein
MKDMSRSLHTRPYSVLAADRVRAPYEPRRSGDSGADYAVGRALKELGIAHSETTSRFNGDETAPLPRLAISRPRHSRVHPLTRADITVALRFFGEACVYGIRSISLVNGQHRPARPEVHLGTYVVPGRVLLFDQSPPPWELAGQLPEVVDQRLRRAGADIEVSAGGLLTVVRWPGDTLRTFMLFDGLMHEIGHHILQHSKGKRGPRVVRTKDHELMADRFAQKCRHLFGAGKPEAG